LAQDEVHELEQQIEDLGPQHMGEDEDQDMDEGGSELCPAQERLAQLRRADDRDRAKLEGVLHELQSFLANKDKEDQNP